MNFIVTAGYDKSKPALALCELIRKSGHGVAGVIVVTPFSVKRLRGMLLQRGLQGVKKAFAKLLPDTSRCFFCLCQGLRRRR
jgi:hypothetical protein